MKTKQAQGIYFDDSPLKNVMHRSFRGIQGEVEHFFVITAPGDFGFKEQLDLIEAHYEAKIHSLGLTLQSAVFRRIFLSDTLNQSKAITRSHLVCDPYGGPVAVSIIQQPPVPHAKIALLAYHIESNNYLEKERLSSSHVLLRKNGLGHLWSTNLCAKNLDETLVVGAQTRSVFTDLICGLSMAGGDLLNNCIRTWIYVRGIDVFYQGMVDKRRALFAQYGLTGDTHFIASTGIEGMGPGRHDLIMLDAYSIVGISLQQISYLNDLNMLCPANKYNVTFERGTRISYADRSHYFISGTASVDNEGNTLYQGNILKQLDRTLENMDSLLRSGGAILEDMMYMIVYLRDPSDYDRVKERLDKKLPLVPTVFVQAAVCRPEWLIEIEGLAIKAQDQPSYPLF